MDQIVEWGYAVIAGMFFMSICWFMANTKWKSSLHEYFAGLLVFIASLFWPVFITYAVIVKLRRKTK